MSSQIDDLKLRAQNQLNSLVWLLKLIIRKTKTANGHKIQNDAFNTQKNLINFIIIN